MVDRERLERRPVAGALVGELDLDPHLLLGRGRERLRLGLERPPLDEEPLVVGEQAERLPGLHLFAEPDLQVLDLVTARRPDVRLAAATIVTSVTTSPFSARVT